MSQNNNAMKDGMAILKDVKNQGPIIIIYGTGIFGQVGNQGVTSYNQGNGNNGDAANQGGVNRNLERGNYGIDNEVPNKGNVPYRKMFSALFDLNQSKEKTQELPQLDTLNINEPPSQPERDLAMPLEASDTTKVDTEKLITVQNPELQLKIDNLLNSPLKEYRQGRGGLEDLLNIGETINDICDEFDFSERRRNDIDLTKAGGGNSAKVFLEDFKSKHGEKSLEAFKKVLETLKITWPKSESTVNKDDTLRLVSQLSNNCISELSVLLSRGRVWTDIAAEYEYTPEEIEKIKRHQQRPNNYSPAEAFFRFIDQEKPDYSVKEFMVLLRRLKIINAYDHMKRTIINWAELSVGIN